MHIISNWDELKFNATNFKEKLSNQMVFCSTVTTSKVLTISSYPDEINLRASISKVKLRKRKHHSTSVRVALKCNLVLPN